MKLQNDSTQDEMKDSYQQYMADNPELKALLADLLQALIIQKPDNVYQFAHDHFAPFARSSQPKPSFPSDLVKK